MKESQCLLHLQRLSGYFGRHFVYISPRDVLAKSSRQYARAPRGMTRFVLKIEILTHIIGTRPDLALTVSPHYGSCRDINWIECRLLVSDNKAIATIKVTSRPVKLNSLLQIGIFFCSGVW